MTVKEYFEIYSLDQRQLMKPGTYISRLSLISCHFLPDYAARPLESISAADINAAYDHAEEAGLANNTLFGLYAALSSFFNCATTAGLISDSPVSGARKIVHDKRLGAGHAYTI